MPLAQRSSFGGDSVWGEVAALSAESEIRGIDHFLDAKPSGGSSALASDLAKLLHTLPDSWSANGIVLPSQTLLFEAYDGHDQLFAVDADVVESGAMALDDVDSGLVSPASESSYPGSPVLFPLDFELQIEAVASWGSELFGGALPALATKAVDLLVESVPVTSSASVELSSTVASPPPPSSAGSKRKQPAPPRGNSKRGKRDDSSDISASTAVVLFADSSSPSSSPPSELSQKLRSPTKRRAALVHDIFKSEQVLKLTTQAEEEDVDID